MPPKSKGTKTATGMQNQRFRRIGLPAILWFLDPPRVVSRRFSEGAIADPARAGYSRPTAPHALASATGETRSRYHPKRSSARRADDHRRACGPRRRRGASVAHAVPRGTAGFRFLKYARPFSVTPAALPLLEPNNRMG